MTNHYLSTLIWRLPPVLIIHLKRFQLSANGYIKIQSNVEYPITDLDLYDYLGRRTKVYYYQENEYDNPEIIYREDYKK